MRHIDLMRKFFSNEQKYLQIDESLERPHLVVSVFPPHNASLIPL